MPLIPIVVEKSFEGERSYDIYSRLLEDRIILLTGVIDDVMASSVIAQLLYLESKDSNKTIYMYINSPGGSVTSGLAIYDTMQYINCDVCTICVGLAASMAALLLASGTKGKRYGLLNSEVMIHQPLGQTEGQATDILIAAKHIEHSKNKLASLLCKHTNKDLQTILKDTERDYYLSVNEAIEYGIIDEVLVKREH